MGNTAIVIFAFNRPDHLEKTLLHLAACHTYRQFPLYFFIDGPRNNLESEKVNEVKKLAAEYDHGDKRIFSSQINAGLRPSVLNGMNSVFKEFERAIVLEDDICVHPDFLDYHLNCLDLYENHHQIWSVSGFIIPRLGKKLNDLTAKEMFLAPRASSWGWSTWRSRWEMAVWDKQIIFDHFRRHFIAYHRSGGDKLRMLVREMEGKSSSWAILWDYNHFMNKAGCIYPFSSYITNIGLDHSGTHSKPFAAYEMDLQAHRSVIKFETNPVSDPPVNRAFSRINRKLYRLPFDFIRLLILILKGGIQK